MAYEEWNRHIPPEEQMREVAKILAAGLLRILRDRRREGESHSATQDVTDSGMVSTPSASAATNRPHVEKPFDDDADVDPGKDSKRRAFWRRTCKSIEVVPHEQIDAAACHLHAPFHDIDIRDALNHVTTKVHEEDLRILSHVANHGIRSATRELGVTRRRVEHLMERLRSVFTHAGFCVGLRAVQPRSGRTDNMPTTGDASEMKASGTSSLCTIHEPADHKCRLE